MTTPDPNTPRPLDERIAQAWVAHLLEVAPEWLEEHPNDPVHGDFAAGFKAGASEKETQQQGLLAIEQSERVELQNLLIAVLKVPKFWDALGYGAENFDDIIPALQDAGTKIEALQQTVDSLREKAGAVVAWESTYRGAERLTYCGEEYVTDREYEPGHQAYEDCNAEHQCGSCTRLNALAAALVGSLSSTEEAQ